jgi:hypothetical protein
MRSIGALVVAVVGLAMAAPAVAQVPDLSPWDGIWLKTKVKQKGLGFSVGQPGTDSDNFGGTVYTQLHFDPGLPTQLALDVWVREDGWRKFTLPFLYLAGVAGDALLVTNQIPVTPDPVVDPIVHFALAVRITGTVAGGAVSKGKLKTLGGLAVEVDDVPGSDQRFAGSVSLSGKATTKLPPDLPQ